MRILIALFLFLITQFSYASKTYYYYSTGSFCSATPDNVCTSLNVTNAEFSRTYSGDVNVTGEGLTCGFNIRRFNYYGIGQDLIDNFSGEFPYTYHAVKAQKICADDEQFVLNGCVAECVKNDPCEATKDREEQLRVQCGIMSCQAGATIKDLGAGVGMACSSGNGTFIPSEPPAKLKRGECEWVQSGALETPNKLEDVTGDMTEAGGQNAPTYCTTTYKSLGRKWQGAEPSPTQKESAQPSQNAKKFAPSVAAPNADGGCNEGWTLGEFGSGSNLTKVCAAPYGSSSGSGSGSGSGDGSGTCTITGQTKVGGVCSCPTGQTVQNGACSSTSTGNGDSQTCDPTKSICQGSGDGSASTGSITKPNKIENTVTNSWWESNYKDGLSGVWNKHKESFQNTPFVQQLNAMKQGAPNSGTCPSFTIQFLQYGGVIQPPCMIWPVLKAFFLFSTLMLCRRIIFGG